MIKYKYKSSLTFKYTTQLPTTSTLHIPKLNYVEIIRIPTYLTLIETQKQRLPPVDYICFRCGKPNHFIQDCPTNENELYEIKIHKPTGIPKEFLQVSSNVSEAEGAGKNVMITAKGELVRTTARTSEWEQIAPRCKEIKSEFLCDLCSEVMYLPHGGEGGVFCFKCSLGVEDTVFKKELWEEIKNFIEGETSE
ncbi:hypothetical protein CDIK_3433 [Cucumispora dikerogammari]|nr:hypothetical protein CDIK_3433 [Cucumispora dikerogammari]